MIQKLPIEDEMLRLPLVQKLRSLGTGSDTGELDGYQVEDDVDEDGDEDDEDEEDRHEDGFAGSTLRSDDSIVHSLTHSLTYSLNNCLVCFIFDMRVSEWWRK